jgi:hypothetical protein
MNDIKYICDYYSIKCTVNDEYGTRIEDCWFADEHGIDGLLPLIDDLVWFLPGAINGTF